MQSNRKNFAEAIQQPDVVVPSAAVCCFSPVCFDSKYLMFVLQSYGQYWLDDEGCEVGPFIIEPLSVDTSNSDFTVRQLKLTYEPQVRDSFRKHKGARE